jgi:hypothetical protein
MLKKGEMTFRRGGEVLLLSWRGKRVITMVSTVNSEEMVEVSNKVDEARMCCSL